MSDAFWQNLPWLITSIVTGGLSIYTALGVRHVGKSVNGLLKDRDASSKAAGKAEEKAEEAVRQQGNV